MREPTKTIAYWHETFVEVKNPHKENEVVRFYFDPPQRTWVGLTDEEIEERQEEFEEIEDMPFSQNDWLWFYTKAIEAKLKEKNT